MHAALDATPLTVSSGGLRRYTAELSMALSAAYPEDTFTLLSDQAFRLPDETLRNLLLGGAPPTRFERRWWLHGASQAMHRAGIDVFHGTNFEVPYRRLRPAVMTIHDLSPWMQSAWHHDAARVRQRTPWLLRLGRASMVITPTEAVRREVIRHFRLAPDRVVATPLGPTRHLSPGPPTLFPNPYFLFAGTLEPRKNIGMLVDAWREVRKTCSVDLVLAGRRRADGPTFAAEPGLHLAGEVTDRQLAGLYCGAIALVYPSHYEGFGLPVLEAMQCGAAVITSSDPALREVTGDAGLRADSAQELADAMRALLDQPDRLADHRARSLRRAADFDWTRTAHLTYAVYQEAIARFRR